jgi:C-terminal processing protease CtpA/Prc
MLIAIVAGLLITPSPPQRIERMMALARLDAAVRYFDPSVATRPSSWDSLFVASATRIVDAPSSAEYARAIAALMSELHPAAPTRGEPQRGLTYDGFPNAATSSSGGYRIKWRSAGSGETYRVEMGEGASAEVPISEPGADTTPVVNALAMPASPEWRAPFPSPGYRLLAAARLWSTIRLFYPYKALIGESWDDQLRAALPAFENAKDSLEYAQAVARFASHIHDTHVTAGSPALSAYIGTVPVGAAARLIENQLVITRIADSSASRAGLRVGDVVLSVDGEATAQRIAGLTPLYATSTPQSMRYRLQQVMLNGRDSAPAHLVVRGADGERTVDVPRSRRFGQLLSKNRTGSMIRLLPGNIGYIDIDRLPQTSVDSAFRVLANTKAIIIDDRGYPLGTAWAIAPRLNRHTDPTIAAKFKRLEVPSPDTARTTIYEFDQSIPAANGVTKYVGRTVMLVDERTISQAEHTGLFFEAANGTTFMGSPTMGANGDVTVFFIPGGISISFTGHDVRHADGRQLQRVGLQPQVAATPTIAGIRAGRDEVLETAFHYLGGSGGIPLDTLKEAGPRVIALAGEPMVAGWGGGGTMALDNMMNRALRGTMDWTKVSIVLDVPTDADGLSFGLLLSGPGESWIDDASVEIVGSDVSATAPTVTTPTRAGVPVEKVRRMYDTAPLAPVNLGFEPG